MVNFICDACGQTIKKQKVEKHYQTECRNCSVLSCIDCGKDFPGDSYATHTSCISEAEKYQGKLYKEKVKANKGERKQQEWLEQVRNASSDNNQDPRVKKLMAKITSYNNVPRKEAKFKKFCENSINIRDQALLEKLWQAFSGARNSNFSKHQTSDHQNSSKDASNENTDTTSTVPESKIDEIVNEEGDKPVELIQGICKESKHEKKKKHKERTEVKEQTYKAGENGEIFSGKNKKKQKMKIREPKDSNEEESCGKNKKKKRKHEKTIEKEQNEDEIEQNCGFEKKRKLKNLENMEPNTLLNTDCLQEVNAETQVSEKFKWEAVIKKLLKSAPDKEMAVKKLRRKVVNEFRAHGGDPQSRTEQELRALFEKKLHKNPKVKVHKEKAKYCK